MKTSKGHICKGCKNPLPCRTPGCQQCKWRHNYNVSIGKAPKRRECCKTCGTPYTDFNMDCDLCRKRYRVKLIREAGDEHEPKTCAGCGGKINQFTTGCKTCMKRRWSRAKKANLPTRRLTCSKCGYAMIYRNPKCKTCKSREESNKKRGKPPLIRLTIHGPEPKPKTRATPDPHITEMQPGLAAYIRARRARLKKKTSH